MLGQFQPEVGFQCCQSNPAIASAIHIVTGKPASQKPTRNGQPVAQGLRKSYGCVRQTDRNVMAAETAFASQDQTQGRNDYFLGAGQIGQNGSGEIRWRHESHPSLVIQIVPGQLFGRRRIANDRHMAQTRITSMQFRPGKSQTYQGRRPRGGYEEIRLIQQRIQTSPVRKLLEVQSNDFHALVQNAVPLGTALFQGITLGRLDFGNPGSHLMQSGRSYGARQIDRKRNNSNVLQGLHGCLLSSHHCDLVICRFICCTRFFITNPCSGQMSTRAPLRRRLSATIGPTAAIWVNSSPLVKTCSSPPSFATSNSRSTCGELVKIMMLT